ncbi:hypothetical protein ACE6H2_006475 [Prunus campanulata]
MEASSSNSSSKSGLVVANERRPSGGIRIENPFTLKVGQVFTGFGIGCGVGIGVGRPINLGAIPVLNQVMGATRGATDALSGVSRHLRKLGAKNIEAGIGCGVGIGHGFGVPSYAMLGIPKHEEAPPTPQHPLSAMGDACSRMDLTAIHQILLMTHYKDDEGTNELSFQEWNQQMKDMLEAQKRGDLAFRDKDLRSAMDCHSQRERKRKVEMERRGRGRLQPRNDSSRESTVSRTNRFASKPNSTPKSSSRVASGSEKAQNDGEDDPSDLPAIVGTCPLMCPERERAQRERLRDLAVFERLNGNPAQSSPDLAVKKFFRTISTKQVEASDVRPLPVLEDTLNYLLNLFDSREYPFEVVHDFLFDRTRSIRQDLSMQNIVNNKVILMYEKMVKFHVISLHKLQRCSSQNTSSMNYLNKEQLAKTLTSLFNLYDANRDSSSTYENEAEFCSFYVLLHLGSNSQPMVRALAVSCINNGGYKLHPYPLANLSKLLMMTVINAQILSNERIWPSYHLLSGDLVRGPRVPRSLDEYKK